MEQKTYDVFISYSRKDYVDEHNNVIPGNEVSKIKEALTKAKITYWFDEEGVYAGDKFAKVIVQNIKTSSVFVFLSTKNSNQSEWTANEISAAHMLGKIIIPVRIDDSVFHDDVILYIARLSRIDYFNNPEEGRGELIRSIKDYLEDMKVTEAQKAVDEQRRKEELERQRRLQEEEKRLEKIAKIKTEIAALESQRTERKKAVLQKEQELKLAQVDLYACEAKIQKLLKKRQELHESQIDKRKVEKEEMVPVEEKHLAVEKTREEIDAKERIFTIGNVSFKMIRVEGGRFQMGSADSDTDAKDGEKPQHWVTLNDFFIGETVVTQALWKIVMGNNPSYKIGDVLPVENVSWDDAQEFVTKLNNITGSDFCLPKEAEWEYAARGGQKGKGFKYSGSDNIDEVAWDSSNSEFEPHPVKLRKANELGLYDMSGNVWEWCKDWYDENYYSNSPQDNPQGPSSGSYHVVRGGGWFSDAEFCRVACRINGPSYRSNGIGLRLVCFNKM